MFKAATIKVKKLIKLYKLMLTKRLNNYYSIIESNIPILADINIMLINM